MKINENTLQVSRATYERGVELFNEGSISKADLAQLEAQVGNDQYQLVTAESSLRDYKLQLKQLLELYLELLTINHSKVTDEQILQRLQEWGTNSNLKKVTTSLNNL